MGRGYRNWGNAFGGPIANEIPADQPVPAENEEAKAEEEAAPESGDDTVESEIPDEETLVFGGQNVDLGEPYDVF